MRNFLTTAEVASIFGVSRAAVINWINSGKLEHIVLPSGQFRIPREEVARILTPQFSEESESSHDSQGFTDVPPAGEKGCEW